MSRRVLVVGAGGYLGGRLVGHLWQQGGVEVSAGVRGYVPWLPPVEQLVVGPDSTFDDLVRAARGIDAVIHLGAPNETAMAERPDELFAEATTTTARLARACAGAGVGRMVYVSTIHVYGDALTQGIEITEETVPRPRDHYATSRLASEHLVAAAGGRDLDLVVLRFTNVVGAPAHPRVRRWSLVANDLCRQGCTTNTLRLRSDGLQFRDFVPMTDACQVLASAAAIGTKDAFDVPPGTYNVASGRPMKVRELAGLVQEAVERQTGRRPVLVAPAANGPAPPPWHISTERIARLGMQLTSSVEDALDETVASCLTAVDDLERERKG